MRDTSTSPQALRLLLVLAALFLLAACGRSASVSYFQLAPLAGKEPAGKDTAGADLVIGIGPVRLQEHLDRPQLITRTGPSRLHLADRHRWAEPLAANIAWVVRDNLAALLATEHFLLYPWARSAAITCQISLEILHCEGTEDGSALLTAIWSAMDREGMQLTPPRRSSYRVSPVTPDEEGLVGALSEALARLSRDIAAELPHQQDDAARPR